MSYKLIKSTLILVLLIAFGIGAYSRNILLAGSDGYLKSKMYDAVIDVNGNGDYKTVQEAIDHAPANRQRPWKIFIMNGRYNGLVRIPEDKPFIFLIGQDKDKVIISFKINCGNPDNPNDAGKEFSKILLRESDCAVVVVNAVDFYAENITFENTYGVQAQSGPQALAIKTNKDRIAFYNCKFRSFQDTWMTSTKDKDDRVYADNCWVEGAVDYFYGGGNAYIENSTFYCVRGGSVIVAPSHKNGTKWGYVFQHCTIDGNVASADGYSKLGRPWHNEPIAVFLNSIINIPLIPEGWTDMGPAAKLFAEYNSRDQNGKLIDLHNRRTWYQESESEGGRRVEGLKAILNKEDIGKYNYENVIKGSDGWHPRSFFRHLAAPAYVGYSTGMLTWRTIPDAAGYIVFRDTQVIGFTEANTFKLNPIVPGDYFIKSVNKYGSLGSNSDKIFIK